MFGLGAPELIVIVIIALLVVGPNKLPELASSLGKTIKDLKASTQEFTETVVNPTIAPIKEIKDEIQKDVVDPLKGSLDFKSEIQDITDNVLNPIKESVADLNPTKAINDMKNDITATLKGTDKKNAADSDEPVADPSLTPDIPELTPEEIQAKKRAEAEAQLQADIAAMGELPGSML